MNEFTLRKGGFYVDAKGEKRGPMRRDRDCNYLWEYPGSIGLFNKNGKSCSRADPDLIAEWTEEPEVDLTKLTTPFGLLDEVYGPGTTDRLKAHGGPYEIYDGSKWFEIRPSWCNHTAYRVKPTTRKTVTATIDLVNGEPDFSTLRIEE